MIRVLLFLRAWHAELRLWKYGMRRVLGLPGAPPEENLQHMRNSVDRFWRDFSTGYVDFDR